MPFHSRDGRKHLKQKVTQKKNLESPKKLRDTRDQAKNGEFAGMSKTRYANNLPRVAQLQRRQSQPSTQENAQPYYMGKDGEILSGQPPPAPLQETQEEVNQSPDAELEEPREELREEPREEPFVGNIFQAFWMSVSKIFSAKPSSSVDVIVEDSVTRRSVPPQFLSVEDQIPGGSNVLTSKVQLSAKDVRGSNLGRSVSQTNGPFPREAWRRRQESETFSSYDSRPAYGTGFNNKTVRKPRLSKEEMLATRERRVKKSGSPVDSKKFRVVLTKFQNILKEESKRFGMDPRPAAQGLNRTKSLVIDPANAFKASRPSSYGPKSLSNLHQQRNELTKANVRMNNSVSRKSVLGLRNVLASRSPVSEHATPLLTDAPTLEAQDALANTKSTQICLANMQRFRGVNVRSNEVQCDASSSPFKVDVRTPEKGKMNSCQTDPDLTDRSLKNFNEASVQFPSLSSSSRGGVRSEAEVSELSFAL